MSQRKPFNFRLKHNRTQKVSPIVNYVKTFRLPFGFRLVGKNASSPARYGGLPSKLFGVIFWNSKSFPEFALGIDNESLLIGRGLVKVWKFLSIHDIRLYDHFKDSLGLNRQFGEGGPVREQRKSRSKEASG